MLSRLRIEVLSRQPLIFPGSRESTPSPLRGKRHFCVSHACLVKILFVRQRSEGRVRDVPGSDGRLLLPTLDSMSLHGSWLLRGLVAASR